MARRQGIARCRGTSKRVTGSPPEGPPWSIRFHTLRQAKDARRFAQEHHIPVELVTVDGLSAYLGAAVIFEIERSVGWPVRIDVGSDAGPALAAIRAGMKHLLFRGDASIHRKLDDMLEQLGGTVKTRLDLPEIELQIDDDAASRLRSCLGKMPGSV